MHIQFVKDHKVQQHDGKGPEYEAGVAYTFDGFVAETYARKYIARGYAFEVVPEQIASGGVIDGDVGDLGVVGDGQFPGAPASSEATDPPPPPAPEQPQAAEPAQKPKGGKKK